MRIVAVLGIRNEEAYLANCLRHLMRNGIDFVIIDNGSTDGSAAIYSRREFASALVDVWHLSFEGVFSLGAQVAVKTAIIESLAADWVMHLDADEEMHSRDAGERLCDAIARIDDAGWNAINFDEFVFVPIDDEYRPEIDGQQSVSSYYFFEPVPHRLMRIWRRSAGLTMEAAAGHTLTGPNLRLAPENFVLRHYIVRDQIHAYQKYEARMFSQVEVAKGWHGNRVGVPKEAFRFPPAAQLKRLINPQQCDLDRSEPWSKHYWQRPGA